LEGSLAGRNENEKETTDAPRRQALTKACAIIAISAHWKVRCAIENLDSLISKPPQGAPVRSRASQLMGFINKLAAGRLTARGSLEQMIRHFREQHGLNVSNQARTNMQVKALETFCTRDVGFVRVTMDTGQQGWGQVSPYNADITCQVFHRQVAPYAMDTAATDLEATLIRIAEREHKFPGSYLRRAMAGFDTAVWDARGRAEGKPVVSLLGGEPGPVRAYGSSMRRDINGRDEAWRLCALRDQFGFDAFKFRVGAECGRDVDEWPGRTEEVVTAVCAALGDDVTKLADGNSGFSALRAIEVGHFLADQGVTHFEEPCPYWDLEATQTVTQALEIDVTGGEQDCDLATWKRMLDMRAVDIAQPDVMYVGGMCRALEVSRMAHRAGLPVTPHAANLSLVTVCTAHLLRAIPNAGKYLEFSIEGDDVYPWQRGLFEGDPFAIKDGQFMVSDEPGWGVEVSRQWLADASRAVTGGKY
jgi:L-alanine-DL-glutamate epimerase-like enolase superfamily enzyme